MAVRIAAAAPSRSLSQAAPDPSGTLVLTPHEGQANLIHGRKRRYRSADAQREEDVVGLRPAKAGTVRKRLLR